MRSPSDDRRVWFERASRTFAFLSLFVVAVAATREGVARRASVNVGSTDLTAGLQRATLAQAADLRLRASYSPSAPERAWLRALRASGTPVLWDVTRPLVSPAIGVEPAVTPDQSPSVALIAPSGTTVVLSDAASRIDSVSVGASGRLVLTGVMEREVHARLGAGETVVARVDTIGLGRVLVLGRADWETKYVLTALEEEGWQVDARVRVAPEVMVTQGGRQPIDTSRYAAVVVLDTAVARVEDLATYVRSGGGLLIANDATLDRRLLALAGAGIGVAPRAEIGALVSSNARRGLSARALLERDSLSVVLERRGPAALVVARRVGVGRVAASGYVDTWRWRMQGGDGSVEAHRTWWSNAVGGVAYVRLLPSRDLSGLDGAPYAAMLADLGPPSTGQGTSAPLLETWLLPLAFLLTVLSLLTEWGSRRLRGAK